VSAKEPIVIREMFDGRVVSERVVPALSEATERKLIEGDRRELIRKLRLVDRPELAKRLREGGLLLKHEREFLADLVEGKKPPRHRPSTVDAALRRDSMAEDYLHLKAHNPHLQNDEIERSIASFYGVSTGYLRRAVRSLNPQRRKSIEKLIAKVLAGNAEAEKMVAEGKKELERRVREFNELSPSKRKRLVKKILDGYVKTFGSLPEEFVRKYGTEVGDFSSKKTC
jgi:hypothetical protein